MRLLVTMRIVENATYAETRDAAAHDWDRFFVSHGIIPIFVPNALPDPTVYFEAVDPAGLILTGGDGLGETMPTLRDRTEEALLHCAIDMGLPVFGVCRGLQMINSHFGGGTARSIPSAHIGRTHAVNLAADYSGVGGRTQAVVNSFHVDGVAIGQLAPALRSFASSDDGFVEGLFHPQLPIVAVQWHPERDNPAADLDRSLFQDWLARCA